MPLTPDRSRMMTEAEIQAAQFAARSADLGARIKAAKEAHQARTGVGGRGHAAHGIQPPTSSFVEQAEEPRGGPGQHGLGGR